MPTYEYRCDGCEHEMEAFQSITASPLKKCPECGKQKLKRLISGGGALLFKGSGFYETDYRSADYKKAAEKESKSSETKSDKKSDKKAEAKPEKKSDPKPKVESKPKKATKS